MSDADETRGATIEDYLLEERTFPPPTAFKAQALVAGTHLYDEADEDYQGFWARQAADLARPGSRSGTRSATGSCPFAKWFVGGKLNVQRELPRPPRRRRAAATGWRSTGRASRATPAPSPTPTCSPRSSASPTCSRASA